MKLFLDIETIPAPTELEPLLQTIYEQKRTRSSSFDHFLHGTSLSGNFGRILCIGYAIDNQPVQVLTGKEPEQLASFWNIAAPAVQFIGHNAFDFDLPFILKRSIIHQIKPSQSFAFQSGTNQQVFDTMREWDGWGHRGTSLDHLTKILGIETPKQGIDGSQVWDFFRAGRLQEIYDYCQRDVEAIRAVYERLTFTAHAA